MKAIKIVTCLLAAVSLLATSCEKTKEGSKKNPYAGVKMVFTLKADTVEGEKASIRVKHDADDATLKWYACLTEDLESSLNDVVAVAAAELDPNVNLYVGKNKPIELKNLVPETNYRFIAFGVDFSDNGTVWTYGTPAELTFKTSKDLNVIFSATEPVVNRNTATLTVSYDKAEDAELTWYGFLTTKVGRTTQQLIDEFVNDVEIPASDLKSGKDVEITLSDLDFSTTYHYIVTGVQLKDGKAKAYGTAVNVEFQVGEKFFLEPTWTLSHSIDETTYPGYPHKLTNTVASGSNAGKYIITVYTEDDIEDTSNLPGFIEEILPDEVDYLKYLAEKNQKTLSDYLEEGTASDWYRLSYKKYYIFAIGLTDEGEATGAYAYMTYYNEPDQAAKDAYNSWLGNWLLGADSIPVEVVENELCVNYRIQGYASPIVPEGFLASFDASDNSLVFYNHTVTIDEDGYEVQWNGLVNYQGNNVVVSGGAYTIGTATMSADGKSADIAAGKVTLSAGGDYTVVGMNYYAHSGNSVSYYIAYPDPILIPTTMVRASETGSEAYNNWIGNWDLVGKSVLDPQVDSTYYTINISQKFPDVSYNVSGWGYGIDKGYTFLDIPASFNSGDASLSFSGGSQSPVAAPVDLGDGKAYGFYLMGLADIDGDYYRITGSYPICTVSMGDGGVGLFTGESVELEGSVTAPFVWMFWAVFQGTYDESTGIFTQGDYKGGYGDSPLFEEAKLVKSASQPTRKYAPKRFNRIQLNNKMMYSPRSARTYKPVRNSVQQASFPASAEARAPRR